MFKTNISKYVFLFIATVFVMQIVLQSIPIAETIVINGDAICTCGCGHTVAKCAENHGDGHKMCKCNHQKEEETLITFIPNQIKDLIIYQSTKLFKVNTLQDFSVIDILLANQFTINVLAHPPQVFFI